MPSLRLWLLWHHHSGKLQHIAPFACRSWLRLCNRAYSRRQGQGFAWYENGKRDKKTNTFKDFIAAAQHLVKEGFTSHDRIVAHGGSAGGMLMAPSPIWRRKPLAVSLRSTLRRCAQYDAG
ncbi:prolyl oligopeptidase family serine peptidase [Brucella inopinata]|uniref:prolyl oligopeptidase family serine peptidase n=1 Tax=Brucella inopinata TaxID=1218315 RepID=UPI001FDEABB2|nr:prolyl oligopeptidase family serine peptidase [Brucella inopinata]